MDGGANFVWPFESIPRHAVVLGASGMGKTETSMRIAYEVASKSDVPVFYLDPKEDRKTAERFVGLMGEAGRRAQVFPNERFDAWRGDWRGIVNRLLEVVDFATEGPAAYYRDIAKTALQLACNHPDGPPRSSVELLSRLDYETLLIAHAESGAVRALPREKVSQVRMCYEAFFGQLGSVLDGKWSWEGADAAYFLLDSVALGEDAFSLARLLFADFAHYFSPAQAARAPLRALRRRVLGDRPQQRHRGQGRAGARLQRRLGDGATDAVGYGRPRAARPHSRLGRDRDRPRGQRAGGDRRSGRDEAGGRVDPTL